MMKNIRGLGPFGPSLRKAEPCPPASRLLLGVWVLLSPSLGAAAPVRVAVAAFDYADTSGEPTDQVAAHAERLKMLQQGIVQALDQRGFDAVPLVCASAPCSASNLDQGSMQNAAKKQNAPYVVFGGVHKISTLIEFGHVDVMDSANGHALLSREVQFRGDTNDAWQHAASYIGDMAADTLSRK